METLEQIFQRINSFIRIPLFKIGPAEISVWTIIYLSVFLFILIYLSGKLKRWILARPFLEKKTDVGARQAAASIFRYVIITIGAIIILQTAGIDLSALTIIFGALGVGVGFGLQGITNNIVSGLIILFERPIKVGDRIEVGNVTGDVVSISPRATTIVTNDNIAIIVPNSELISSKVINWSYTTNDVRFNIHVGVSYSSDPEVVRRLLVEVAEAHPGVLTHPKPDVIFAEFGDSSLKFNLRVWTREYTTKPFILQSELNYAISKKFKENGIEIPFPQRDIHIRTGELQVKSSSPHPE